MKKRKRKDIGRHYSCAKMLIFSFDKLMRKTSKKVQEKAAAGRRALLRRRCGTRRMCAQKLLYMVSTTWKIHRVEGGWQVAGMRP